MSCGIYKFENKINHKIYIGLASDLKARYDKHKKNILDKNHQELIYQAFREYGWDNFDYEILESFPDEEYDSDQLSKLEDYYINYYNSLQPNGYNMVPGGYNGSGLAKGKPILQYDLQGNFIAEYKSAQEASKKTGINHSSICASARGDIRQIKGFQWYYKDSNINPQIIEKKYIQQSVYQFSLTDGTIIAKYNTIKEASEITGIDKSLICLSCQYSTKTAGGYQWSHDEHFTVPLKTTTEGKKIQQFTKNNEFIAEYNNLTEAAKITHINLSNIGEVCKGKRKTAGGYIWKYKINN